RHQLRRHPVGSRRPRAGPGLQEQAEAAGDRHARTAQCPPVPRASRSPPGATLAESVAVYARRRGGASACSSASARSPNVTLRQPAGSVVTLHGRFEILSLSGTVLPPPAPPGPEGSPFSCPAGQGRWSGGTLWGRWWLRGRWVLMAASFANAVFERLPLEEEEVVVVGGHVNEGGEGGGDGGGSFYNSGGGSNTTPPPPPPGSYPFSAELFGWGSGGGASARPPF
ncbi:putative DNA-binding protein escarola, partial [Phtheirospermum japonicum]